MGLEEESFYTRTCIGAVFSPIAAVAILATYALVFVAGATLLRGLLPLSLLVPPLQLQRIVVFVVPSCINAVRFLC